MARSIGNTILILAILIVLNIQAVTAQTKGVVLDATDNTPVAGATIYDFYGRVIARADSNGNFFLNNIVNKRLLFTSVGYKPLEFVVENDSCKDVSVLMEPEDLQLSEVIVRGKHEKYRRRNNPAVELMRKVISAKRKTDIKNKSRYGYLQYQKLMAGFNDLKQEDLQIMINW